MVNKEDLYIKSEEEAVDQLRLSLLTGYITLTK